MSLLNKASLIQIPSGYKDGTLYSAKPTNGDGDFTFSRGSNLAATRVNSEGLIEKGRENLLTYSNDFSNWNKALCTATSGQSGYDGTNDAWLLTATGSGNSCRRDVTYSGVSSFSVYAKAGTADGIRLRFDAATDKNLMVDLTDGSVISAVTTAFAYSVEDVGGGWYRVTATADLTSGINVRLIVTDDTGTQSTGSVYIQDAQLEVGLVSTDVITTTTTTEQAGILEDMPRLDYSGGASCPSLLLEGQRSNLVTNSEYRGTSGEKISITYNDATSPEGVDNAVAIVEDSQNGRHRTQTNTFSVTSGNSYTLTLFAKIKSGTRLLCINAEYIFNARAYFDLVNGDVEGTDSGSASIEDYGNGWYRCIITGTATTTRSSIAYIGLEDGTSDNGYQGDGTSGHYWYGLQVEEGSYSTSYIPTYGSSVTRSEDVCVNGGDSSTFNDSEGVFFFQGSTLVEAGETRVISISDGSTSNNIYMNFNNNANSFNCEIIASGSTQFNPSVTMTKVNNNKIAIKYKENDFALWINGVEVATDTSGSTPTGLDRFNFDFGQGSFDFKGNVKQTLYFNTALSDTELADLTTL